MPKPRVERIAVDPTELQGCKVCATSTVLCRVTGVWRLPRDKELRCPPAARAGRMAVLADPEGAVFSVWQAGTQKGARIVNEHGSLNFNRLATRDPEGAKAFYGAVFGWGTLALPAGLMWTLPGYGDHLEERSPGLRVQMAQMAAPEGFIDVVAALTPIAPGDSETPAHWSVTFAVDDADAVAARARELGGDVVAGPFDAPWTRMAVIRDPQGATFIASQFVPENRDLQP
jgi:predicted enzyme related to lactoylglutathione lyase